MQIEKFSSTQLSAQLRNITQEAHSKAEGSSFIKKLFHGACSEQEYYLYLWAMQSVYTELEIGLTKNKVLPSIAPIYFKMLLRENSLQYDMQEWKNFSIDIPVKFSFVVQEYTSYLQEISAFKPHLLVAHAYVRYMGDLSGGQILAKILKKRFPDSKALSFYVFPISDMAQMKQAYREGLDIIGAISAEQSEQICKESVRAFEFNAKIFEEISSDVST